MQDPLLEKIKNKSVTPDAVMSVNFSGVYFLFHNDELRYVGQSKQVPIRIYQHKQMNKFYFNRVSFLKVKIEHLLEMESYYIKLFNPPENRTGPCFEKTLNTDDSDKHRLQELADACQKVKNLSRALYISGSTESAQKAKTQIANLKKSLATSGTQLAERSAIKLEGILESDNFNASEKYNLAIKAAFRLRKTGKGATPAAVLTSMEGIKLAGGLKTTVLRQVLRLCKGKVGNWHFNQKTYKEIAEMFGVKEQMVKDSTRTIQIQKLPYTPETEKYIEEIATGLGLKLEPGMVTAACMCHVSKRVIATTVQAIWQLGRLPKKEETVSKLKKLDYTIDYNFVQNSARMGAIKTHQPTMENIFSLKWTCLVLGISSETYGCLENEILQEIEIQKR